MRRRAGFTITELLVAMALIIFVMSILATAFSEGMKTFRALKGIGDMNQRLRTVAAQLREDLQAPHFEGRRRLSDPNFWSLSALPAESGPPREGFVRIWQGSPLTPPSVANPNPPYCLEGTDLTYNLQSLRATDHILHFTVKKLGNDQKDFFRAAIPYNGGSSPLATFGNSLGRYQDQPTPASIVVPFTSQWAEVAWFMRPNGYNANGTPLFTLYRRQRVVVGDPETGGAPSSYGVNLNWGTNPNTGGPWVPSANYNNLLGNDVNYLGISCQPPPNPPNPTNSSTSVSEVYFNSPSDLTVPQYRFSMQPGVAGGIPPQATGSYPPFLSTGAYYYYVFQPNGTAGANSVQEWTNLNIIGPTGTTISTNLQGADAIVTDVLSFAVRVLPIVPSSGTPNTSGGFVDLPALGTSANSVFAATASTGPFVYDTWSSLKDSMVNYSQWNVPNTATSVPFQLPIAAIQIQLRVWDNKTEQSRQMTIVVDM